MNKPNQIGSGDARSDPRQRFIEMRGGVVRALLWWCGWHAGVLLVLAIAIGGLAAYGLDAPAGFLLGAPVLLTWFAGTRVINATFGDLLQPAAAGARTWATHRLGVAGTPELFMLIGRRGSGTFVKPPREVVFNVLVVSDAYVAVAEGFTLDLVNRRTSEGAGTKELYFRHISSVDFRPPYFQLNSSSGEVMQYETDADAAQSAIVAVRRRLRQS